MVIGRDLGTGASPAVAEPFGEWGTGPTPPLPQVGSEVHGHAHDHAPDPFTFPVLAPPLVTEARVPQICEYCSDKRNAFFN